MAIQMDYSNSQEYDWKINQGGKLMIPWIILYSLLVSGIALFILIYISIGEI
jgi:hypothetical protein